MSEKTKMAAAVPLEHRDFLPFALPDIGDEEIAEVVDSLRSDWITTGPKTRRFEQEFTGFLGGDVESIAVNSATAGLHLALEACGIGPGHEVITTTHTFTATAEVIRYLGAHPRFLDISAGDYCIDPRLIEAAVTPRTRAIIPVHYGGINCDMQSILQIARRHGLKVIEDAAHAIPTTCEDKLVGTLGSDASVFSFYATKTIATGEGGMVVTRDPEIAARCKVMRLHGIDRDAFDRYTANKPSWYYQVVAPGFKYNMTDLAASLGLHQLKKAYRFHRRRQEIAQAYDAGLAALPLILPPRKSNELHAWHLYVVRLNKPGINRDDVIRRLAETGIGSSVHYIPLHLHPYWKQTYGLRPEDFPVSQDLFENCISLPIYTRMTDEDVQRVISALRTILNEGEPR